MTPAQLALKYKIVSRSLLYAACQDGLIPHYRLSAHKGKRGKYAIREADFLAWLETNKHIAGQVETPLVHITPR